MANAQQSLVCLTCGRQSTNTLGALCEADGAALVPVEAAPAKGERRDPVLGRVVAGRFPVVGLIGRGAFGTVYRAIQLPVGREVALKVMNVGSAHDEQLRTRFFREARVVARLSHPSAVTLFDYGEDPDGLLYMVLEYIPGHTLKDVITDEAPLAPARVVALTLQVLGALVEAHGLGLIHRDLKPANIMLTREKTGEERAKVLDFGMAKVLQVEAAGWDEATRTGVVVGTPRYLSPEQALAREVGPQTDVYALGVLMYELLVGEPPFVAPSTFELLMLHTSAEVPRIEPVLAVPEALEAVMRRALAKQVEHRFADAQAMLDALREVDLPGLRRSTTGPMRRPRRTSTEVPTARLSGDALKAVAARTASLMPDAQIATSVRPDALPPVDHDALDGSTSAAHGEVSGLAESASSSGRRWWLAAAVVALGVAGWLALKPAPESTRSAAVAADPEALTADATVSGLAAVNASPPDSALPDSALPDSALPDSAAAEPDAEPDAAEPDATEPDASPAPGEEEVRAALATARRMAPAADALARGDAAAGAVDAYLRTVDDRAERGQWLMRRAKVWRRIAESHLGETRRTALLRARDDYVAAMNDTDRTRNFGHYKTAVGLTQELFGELSDEAVAVACAPANVADYVHRANYCALLEIRAGLAVSDDDPNKAALLVCRGAARFPAALPGQGEAGAARRQREKRSYGNQCAVLRRSAEE